MRIKIAHDWGFTFKKALWRIRRSPLFVTKSDGKVVTAIRRVFGSDDYRIQDNLIGEVDEMQAPLNTDSVLEMLEPIEAETVEEVEELIQVEEPEESVEAEDVFEEGFT